MVTELILNGLFGIADIFLELMPAMEWTVDTSSWQFAKDALDMICYMLPIDTIRQIISLIVAVTVFRITISFYRAILGLIPFIG